ncbi:MAG: hypothetical protein SFY67_05320 [Candidatus Melainabacteria bacterium]|nr:hypothetical protein [Candidatus Melainabacteria bacterium]
MTIEISRKYVTTWVVFLILLFVVVLVFFITSRSPKPEYAMSVGELKRIIRESPTEINSVIVFDSEPVVVVRLKGKSSAKQVIVPNEQKSELVKDFQSARIQIQIAPPDKADKWIGVRAPGVSVDIDLK